MQFGFFLLVAAAVLLLGSDIASASIDADITISKTSSNLLTSADAVSPHGKVGRFLRTSEIADATSDDENKESDDEERTLPSVVTEKAAGTAAKLTRSKSLPNEKAVVQKLTRSKSAKRLNTKLTVNQVQRKFLDNEKRIRIRSFERMDLQHQTPDEMFLFFSLDRRFAGTTKANKGTLGLAGKGDEETYSYYVLWYKYTKFYKQRHPDWVSQLLPKVVKAE